MPNRENRVMYTIEVVLIIWLDVTNTAHYSLDVGSRLIGKFMSSHTGTLL